MNKFCYSKFIIVLLTIFFLYGCINDDDKSSTTKVPENRPDTIFTGSVPLEFGNVKFYSLSEDGTVGEQIGETNVNVSGNFTFNLNRPAGFVYLQASDGSYVEPASGAVFNAEEDQILSTIIRHSPGDTINVKPSFFSHIGTGMALCYVINKNMTIESAISKMNTIMSDWLAGVNVFSVDPASVTASTNNIVDLNEAITHGFYVATLSQITKQVSLENDVEVHSVPHWTSLGLANIIYKDYFEDKNCLMDGLIDGNDGKRNLAMGVVGVDAKFYRNYFAEQLLTFVNSDNNKTGIVVDDLLSLAIRIAGNKNESFGAMAKQTYPLDDQGPVITSNINNDAFFTGNIDYPLSVDDLLGISEITYQLFAADDDSMSNVLLEGSVNTQDPSVVFDTSVVTDGRYKIVVAAYDKMVPSNSSNESFFVNINNSGPAYNYDSIGVTNKSSVDISGVWNSPVALLSFTVQGREVTLDGNSWSVSVDLVSGSNTIEVYMEDELGNITTDSFVVNRDVVDPVVGNVRYSNARISLLDGQYVIKPLNENTGPLYYKNTELSLRDAALEPEVLEVDNIPHITFEAYDPMDNGVFTEDPRVSMRYILEGTIMTRGGGACADQDNGCWYEVPYVSGSSNTRIVPLVTEYLNPDWHLVVPSEVHKIVLKVEDDAGNVNDRFEYIFKVDVVAEKLVLIETNTLSSDLFSGVQFAERQSINGIEYDSHEYTMKNEAPESVLVQFYDNNAHVLEQRVDTAVRQHNIRRMQHVEWRAGVPGKVGFEIDNCGTVPQWDNGTGSPYWFNVTQMRDWENGQWNTVNIPQDSPVTSWIEHNSDNLPNGSNGSWANKNPGQYHGTGLVTNTYPPFNPYTEQYDEDFLVPVPAGYQTFMTTTRPFNDAVYQTRDNYTSYYRPWAAEDKNVWIPTVWLQHEAVAGCTDYQFFQEKIDEYYVSQEGYPKNVTGSITIPHEFNTTGFSVENITGGGVIIDEGGWYEVPGGSTIRVTKRVLTPNASQVTNFDDTEVADLNSFDSYIMKEYDRTLTWKVNRSLNISAVHNAGLQKSSGLTEVTTNYGEGVTNYVIAR